MPNNSQLAPADTLQAGSEWMCVCASIYTGSDNSNYFTVTLCKCSSYTGVEQKKEKKKRLK